MSKTISRRFCNSCKKNNLCTWKYQGIDITKCKTDGCNAVIDQDRFQEIDNIQYNQNDFINADDLEFFYPESYRGISKDVLEKLQIEVTRESSEIVRYTHINLDKTVSVKRRYPNKVFDWKPKSETTSLFGLHLCQDFTRPLFITEGNEDCATLWQLGYQACSVLSAPLDEQTVLQDIETFKKFPKIYLVIENDKAGKGVKESLKRLLNMIELREVDLSPRKDANDWIRDDTDIVPDPEELIIRIEEAKEILPSGIIFGDQIDSVELRTPLPKGVAVPFPGIMNMVKGGILPGDLWILCAGVSIGKSTILRRCCSEFQKQGLKVANLFVEESKQVSQLNYIAEELGYPIGDVLLDPTIIPKEEWDRVFNNVLNNKDLMFVDEYWERTTDNLLKTIEYLANVKKYDIIVLDHITAIINSSGVGKGGKVHDIDWLMEQLFNVCRRTKVRLLVVSHLKRPSQQPYWDEGRKPSMYDMRGSGSLESKPDVIIGLSRNMKDVYQVDKINLEVLKNRWFSELGMADELTYIKSTGRVK